MLYRRGCLPGDSAIAGIDYVNVGEQKSFLRWVIGFRGVDNSIRGDVREHVAIPRMAVDRRKDHGC